MNQNNNLKVSLENKKDPYLKLRYSRGLGDFIACILHSKIFGWLTKLITGKSKPCGTCSKRADALNVLFPIPFWRMFFKDIRSMIEILQADLKDYGYEVSLTGDGLGVASFKTDIIEKNTISQKNEYLEPIDYNKNNYINNYDLITSGENVLGEFLIKTEIYKRK
jgi:hypothetical protein